MQEKHDSLQTPSPLTTGEEEFAQHYGLDDPKFASDDEEVEIGTTIQKVNLLNKFALHSSLMCNNNDQRETIFHPK